MWWRWRSQQPDQLVDGQSPQAVQQPVQRPFVRLLLRSPSCSSVRQDPPLQQPGAGVLGLEFAPKVAKDLVLQELERVLVGFKQHVLRQEQLQQGIGFAPHAAQGGNQRGHQEVVAVDAVVEGLEFRALLLQRLHRAEILVQFAAFGAVMMVLMIPMMASFFPAVRIAALVFLVRGSRSTLSRVRLVLMIIMMMLMSFRITIIVIIPVRLLVLPQWFCLPSRVRFVKDDTAPFRASFVEVVSIQNAFAAVLLSSF